MDEEAWIHPEDLRLLIKLVRWRRNWTQEELAAASGVSVSSIYEYEKGFVPPRKTLEKIVAAAGHSLDLLQVSLLPGLATLRLHDLWQGQDPAKPELTLKAWVATVTALLHSARTGLSLSGREREEAAPPTVAEQREAAGPLCETLVRATLFERQVLVTRVPAFRGWAVVERLCLESEAAASHDATQALELAELARQAAEKMEPAGPLRTRTVGATWAYVGNARRVDNDLDGAREAFARSRELWQAGASGDPHPLEEWRILSLEASFRIDTQEFERSFECLDTALEAAPLGERGPLLLKKATVFEQQRQCEKALVLLAEAEPLLDPAREPRHISVLLFNRAVNLSHLRRFAEAEAILPAVRERAAALGRDLDLVRTHWLEGRVWIGLGRIEEGHAALTRVEAEFHSRGMAFDGALVNLDLAEVELGQGKTARVKQRAAEMWWIFRGGALNREARTALELFCRAANQEAATVELARRIREFLERAEHDPALRFQA